MLLLLILLCVWWLGRCLRRRWVNVTLGLWQYTTSMSRRSSHWLSLRTQHASLSQQTTFRHCSMLAPYYRSSILCHSLCLSVCLSVCRLRLAQSSVYWLGNTWICQLFFTKMPQLCFWKLKLGGQTLVINWSLPVTVRFEVTVMPCI